MRTGDLFFIFIILIVVCFGGMLALASGQNPTTVTDSFGNSASDQTNKSAQLVTTIMITETDYSGIFIVFTAVALIIVVVLGIMVAIKKGNLGRGRYRTG